MSINEPKEFNLTDEGLILSFSDNRYLFPYRYLRLQCPCANCVEEMTGRNILNVDSVPDDIFIVDHLVIGNYAYQFLWSNADSAQQQEYIHFNYSKYWLRTMRQLRNYNIQAFKIV